MTGQINRGTTLGELIYEMASQPDVNTVVEIGTWNGMGTTQCIIDGLKGKESFKFLSLESSPAMYKEATKNVRPDPRIDLILGRIIEPENIPPMMLNDIQKQWLSEDIANYKMVPNVLSRIPDKIDLLVMDGGEFTSEIEFTIIGSRTKYLVLDDTNPSKALKFVKVRNDILNGLTPFRMVRENLYDRNGWLFAKIGK